MITKFEIEKDLQKLNALYENEADPTKELFYAKIAIIELSSWIEHCLDVIAKRAIKNRLVTSKFTNLAEKSVNDNYGFKYKINFMPMLGKLAGYEACESLEADLQNAGIFLTLTALLSSLNEQRNRAAHVGIRHTTYDSPSVTLDSFNRLHPIVKQMYSWAVC